MTKTLSVFLTKRGRLVVGTDPANLLRHTLVLAQSGSGKSFMMGRLIEELMLKTKARVVILDPNSDFVRLRDVETRAWGNADLATWFPAGDTETKFRKRWAGLAEKDALLVTTQTNLDPRHARGLLVDWGCLDAWEMAAYADVTVRDSPDMFWFLFLTRSIATDRWSDPNDSFDFEFFRDVADEVVAFMTGGSAPPDVARNPLAQSLQRSGGAPAALRFQALVEELDELSIWRSAGDGEDDVSDLVSSMGERSSLVVDLHSLPSERSRIALTTRLLSALWSDRREQYADAMRKPGATDKRVPVFVVLDEAHNLAPAEAGTAGMKRVVAELTRIAAEGRKYGLFLILATQRPRKLETSILTECGNLVLMRMTNAGDLEYAAETLGFLTKKVALAAKRLGTGDVILAGAIGDSGTIHHVAPRRTREGGKGVSKTYWIG